MKSLGIDIGGTGIKGALVDTDSGALVTDRHRVLTPQPATPEALTGRAGEVARHFEWGGPAGIGFPGPIKYGQVLAAPNLDPQWLGLDAGEVFERALGCPVRVLNDADAAGLAEMRFGAGRDVAGLVLVVTFGTGLGTALFMDGRLIPNTELGHVELRGKDAEERASDQARVDRGWSFRKWARRVDEYLGYLERLLWPDLVIVGGGVSKHHQKFLPLLTLRARVVPAEFLNNAGIVGAALAAAEGVQA